MTSTQLLRGQHDDAIAMIDRLFGMLNHYKPRDDAFPIALQLARLTQLMRLHFVQEDYGLYPGLVRSSDPEVAEAASAFQRESGELWAQLEAFIRRWSSSTVIADGFDLFKAEGTAIFGAIEDRCKRENDLLFPLAEALAARGDGASLAA
jgi:hypothetical protein